MYQVEAACSAGVRFYTPCHILAVLCSRMSVMAAGTDTTSFCNKVHCVTEGKLFGELFVSGHFFSGGFCPRWLFDSGAYGPRAFVRGLFVGALLT